MNHTKDDNNPFKKDMSWAAFRLGLWPLVVYLIMMVLSYFSETFIGLNASWQNILYGAIAAFPFWGTILLYLFLTGKTLLKKKKQGESNSD